MPCHRIFFYKHLLQMNKFLTLDMSTTQIIKPKLGVFDLSIIVISLVIGMGIFRTPSEVATKAGTPEIFFLAWTVGAVVSLFGALTFAEIGSRIPSAGGFYKLF